MTTIVVAVAALLLSTIFNVATLVGARMSLRLAQQTYVRTEERYASERIEARNDKLRAALLEVSKVVNGPWFNASVQYEAAAKRLGRLVNRGDAPAEQVGAALAAWTKVAEERLNPAIGDAKSAFKNVRFLAEGITDLTAPLQNLASRLGENVPEPLPGRMPSDGTWFFDTAARAADERDAVVGCDMALFVAAMHLFSRVNGSKSPLAPGD
jgi:hypothetical protein